MRACPPSNTILSLRTLLSTTALTRMGLLGAGLSLAAQPAVALPQNGTVVGGSAAIVQTSPNQLTVDQGSQNAVIDWRSFSIGSGQSTVFNQPSASAIAVNRVTGVDPSQIVGRLSANGQVVIINPNGVLFDKTAKVNVGGLVASTSSISTANAMAGRMVFDQPSTSPGATIVNRGSITAARGGLVALVAPGVANSGVITASRGRVALASGYKWTLDLYGDRLVNFALDDQVAAQVAGPDSTGTGITDSGSILAPAGRVELTANVAKGVVTNAVNMSGVIEASSVTSRGGTIVLSAPQGGVSISGKLSANGISGGAVTVEGDSIVHQGTIHADGTAGPGGKVMLAAASTYIDTAHATTTANGTAKGGTVAVSSGFSFYSAGHTHATSRAGQGGTITMTGGSMSLVGADIDASGFAQGGTIMLGGGLHGTNTIAHAATVQASPATTLKADATGTGNGGSIGVWSDQNTVFAGAASARGGASAGDGGTMEVSSAGTVTYAGTADAGAPNGLAGQLLLDPKTIIIDQATGTYPQMDLLNPNPGGGGTFGSVSVVLSSGNLVVTDPTATIGAGPVAVGASYLFNGMTGQLISVLTGSHAADRVGASVTTLTNGNYVVSESTWNGGMGAATFGSGMLGVSGSVSAVNSLTGSLAGDHVGASVTALANGNYVVSSPDWTLGKGAAAFGNGLTGSAGAVSSANALVGTTAGDNVGLSVTALANGNYVVGSPDWNGNKGAASWGSGTLGLTGTISASNSLVGSTGGTTLAQIVGGTVTLGLGDQVGLSVTALGDGNYVVGSPYNNNGIGAATWGNGSVGTTGTISASNSLMGTTGSSLLYNALTHLWLGTAGDRVGLSVTALANGAYVVGSPDWNGGHGAATFGQAGIGVGGTVAAGNSLVGSSAGDEVGLSVTALANGGYVVGSPDWSGDRGAATWSGHTGLSGTVSASNSLVGSTAGDEVGLSVTALANGNYVVGNPDWNGDRGAATFGNGSTGLTGTIAVSNSLEGSSANDAVGLSVTALADGNYVVGSPQWSGNKGAATWGSGTIGATGTVALANSLVGSGAGDEVGLDVAALADGNYVVGSPDWNGNRGAASWGQGSVGLSGTVSPSNSLVGTLAGDQVGSGVWALAGGAYVVGSVGFGGNLGAATYGTAGLGLTGTIDAQNSIIGPVAQTLPVLGMAVLNAGAGYLVSFATAGSGEVAEGLAGPNGLVYGENPTGTVTITPQFLLNTLDTGTSVVLQANDDIIVDSAITASAGGHGGNLTLEAGRSILLNAGITTDNGNLTLIANDTALDGVVNADRDAGAATIQMANGVTINAGTGTVLADLKTGLGNTNSAAAGIALQAIAAGHIDVVDETGGTLTLNGILNASGTGNAIVVSTGVIDNTAGAGALVDAAGRYILYSATPLANTLDGISGFAKHYGITYAGTPPLLVAATGDLSFYSVVPTLDITIGGGTRLYGAATPAFSYNATGLIDGDTLASALNQPVSPVASVGIGAGVGSYDVTASAGLASSLGYALSITNGTMIVTPAPLTVTVDDASRLYGALNPVISATYAGMVNGDTSSVVSGLTYATSATLGSHVGTYAVTVTGGVAANYAITEMPGTLAITPAPLTIAAAAATRVYGAADPVFAGTYSGFVNGDTSAALTAAGFTTVATTSGVGTYQIMPHGLDPDYLMNFVPGTMTITPASLTISADAATRVVGAPDPAFTASLQGLVNGDTSGVVTGLTFSTNATSASPVGTYGLMVAGAVSPNYTMNYGPLAALTVTASAGSGGGTPTPPSSGGGTPTPPSSGGGTPTPPSSGGGTPTPPSSGGGTPTPPSSGGGTPTPPSSGGGTPTPPSSGGGTPTPPSSGGGTPTPPSSGGGMPAPGSPTLGGEPGGQPSGGNQPSPSNPGGVVLVGDSGESSDTEIVRRPEGDERAMVIPSQAVVDPTITPPQEEGTEIDATVPNFAVFFHAASPSGDSNDTTLCLKTVLPTYFPSSTPSQDAETDCAAPLKFMGF